MKRIDYKELINPLILLPILILISYLIGFRKYNLLFYSFIIFFLFSLINNIKLIFLKKIKKHLYLFVYTELIFSLIFMIPLFFLINLKHPIIISISMLGFIDFIIQFYYNVLPRKNGKRIIKLWKDKLIKSERRWMHPISMQKYHFKNFTAEIAEPSKINPTYTLIDHGNFIRLKPSPSSVKHQYGCKHPLVFQIYLNEKQINNLCGHWDNEYHNAKEHSLKLSKNSKLLSKLEMIDKEISKNVITSYMWDGLCRIVFKKDFALKNNQKIYLFLKKIVKLSN